MKMEPTPLSAATWPDPYPFYRRLRERAPLFRDEGLGLVIASGAGAVAEVLTSELCFVRPKNEPVPRALEGSAAGTIFRHLVRMTDGAGHCPLRRAVCETLGALEETHVKGLARERAEQLVRELPGFAFRLPVAVVAELLGVPRTIDLTGLVARFVRCVSPGSTAEEIELGREAGEKLLEVLRDTRHTGGLVSRLADRLPEDVALANGVGFLSQTYEATAGLIGNALLAGAPHAISKSVLEETLRFDAPVQSTRRFVARGGELAGMRVCAGDEILVLLGAANRDPAANPDPDRFDPGRTNRRIFSFGAGDHRCPGERVAIPIAAAGLEILRSRGVAAPREPVTYRRSLNTRVPLLWGAA